jgi:hypothetical protein
MSEWEEIAENTWRLEFEDGYLYRFDKVLETSGPSVSQQAYVRFADVT